MFNITFSKTLITKATAIVERIDIQTNFETIVQYTSLTRYTIGGKSVLFKVIGSHMICTLYS